MGRLTGRDLPGRWALAALLVGCGPGILDARTGDGGSQAQAYDEDAGPAPHRDAGSPGLDAGSTRDGGATDAGTSPDGSSPTDGGGAVFHPCPVTGVCSIMPLGDSITDGVPVGGGYRVELFRRATLDAKTVTYVGSRLNGPASVNGRAFPRNHEGYSGYTIDDAPGRAGILPLVERALRTYTPNIVLLMIGTNDVTANLELAKAPTRLGLLLDRITTTSPEALVVVAKLIPSTDDGLNANIRAYNEGVAKVVSERLAEGKHVLLVDQYDPFIRNASFKTQWMSDWLHPTAEGYVAMAQVWYAAIKSFLPGT
jgi:lysophospholipase L1-like esterase